MISQIPRNGGLGDILGPVEKVTCTEDPKAEIMTNFVISYPCILDRRREVTAPEPHFALLKGFT